MTVQVAEYRATFSRFDADGSGNIDAEELGKLIRVLGSVWHLGEILSFLTQRTGKCVLLLKQAQVELFLSLIIYTKKSLTNFVIVCLSHFIDNCFTFNFHFSSPYNTLEIF